MHARARRRWFIIAFQPCSHRHHLPRKQERDGGGFIAFSPLCDTTPPSCARARRRRWFIIAFQPRSHRHHLPRLQQRDRGSFMAFSTRSSRHHLPRKQQRDGGDFYHLSTSFACHHLPSKQRARWKWFYVLFPVRDATISLTCNSETEVLCYQLSTPFTSPPPPSRAKVSRR